ncbi:MAG: hypothetical protein ABFS21_08895 [Actinomycetota bacterium]
MRYLRQLIILLFPVLLLGLANPVPVVAVESANGPGAVHTDFFGVYFPAGMPGTDTECPYTWVDPAFCVIDQGSWTFQPSGRITIRDMTVFELALSWNDDGVEQRKTGYDIVVANANLDETLTGPTWGTWRLHSFDHELMFTGTFTGKFANGIPAVHFVGSGVGIYEGQKMRGDIGRVPNPYNMFGTIIEPGT